MSSAMQHDRRSCPQRSTLTSSVASSTATARSIVASHASTCVTASRHSSTSDSSAERRWRPLHPSPAVKHRRSTHTHSCSPLHSVLCQTHDRAVTHRIPAQHDHHEHPCTRERQPARGARTHRAGHNTRQHSAATHLDAPEGAEAGRARHPAHCTTNDMQPFSDSDSHGVATQQCTNTHQQTPSTRSRSPTAIHANARARLHTDAVHHDAEVQCRLGDVLLRSVPRILQGHPQQPQQLPLIQ
jgi:hypothetical protein